MNISFLSKKYFSIGVMVVGALVFIMSRPESILWFQGFFGVYKGVFHVGGVGVKRPPNWLLTSSRIDSNREVRIFGVLPSWVAGNKKFPDQKYYAFEDLDVPKSSVVFIEIEEDMRNIFKKAIRESKNGVDGCLIKYERFKGYDAIECLGGSTTSLYLPEPGVSIIVKKNSMKIIDSIEFVK